MIRRFPFGMLHGGEIFKNHDEEELVRIDIVNWTECQPFNSKEFPLLNHLLLLQKGPF
jgi:hypothetical protein